MTNKLSKLYPYIIAFVLFISIAIIYCSPVLQGKVIFQSDVMQAMGMQKEAQNFHEETGDYTLWTNSMFGGMPTYQITKVGEPNYNLYYYLGRIIHLNLPKFSVDIIFIYLLGFFLLLLILGLNPWLSIIGAIGFAFSSYNFVIISVGHVNKALAIGLMPPILGGILLIYRQKYIYGSMLTIIALGIHIYYNHIQMTYYLLILFLIIGIVKFIYAFREKTINKFLIATLVAFASGIIAVIPNAPGLITTYEYGKDTIRGKIELTSEASAKESTGLDKDYALSWSYGKMETFTLLLPNVNGGADFTKFDTKSKTYKALINKNVDSNQARQIVSQIPTYWGNQPGTSGPVYMGAIICFLFVLSLFIVKGQMKVWVIVALIVTVFLAWGRNFMWFTDIFFYYFPMYNKFRAVSSILVVTSILLPLLAFVGLQKILNRDVLRPQLLKSLKYSLFIIGGILLIFLLFGSSMFDFASRYDIQYKDYPAWFINAIKQDRMGMLRKDAIRSILFICLAAGVLYLFILEKIKLNYLLLSLGLLILIDMWSVDKRYLNNDNFETKKRIKELQPTQADLQILQDKDPNFRVLNVTTNPFVDTRTSYFHKSIGGYHAAKLRRYQDLIEHHISKNNIAVLNMLNTKYFIVPGQDKQPIVQQNPAALGNAWFVDSIKTVQNADEEINALTDFDPAHTAILDKRFLDKLPEIASIVGKDSLATIKLDKYQPNCLVYSSILPSDRFAVFSEIYYNDSKGWNAYLDGQKVHHVRVNYVLRGMVVPAGNHTIEFKFEPASYFHGLKIALSSSILAGLILISLIALGIRKKSKTAVTQ